MHYMQIYTYYMCIEYGKYGWKWLILISTVSNVNDNSHVNEVKDVNDVSNVGNCYK